MKFFSYPRVRSWYVAAHKIRNKNNFQTVESRMRYSGCEPMVYLANSMKIAINNHLFIGLPDL